MKHLDQQLTDVTKASALTPLIFSHPVYQYLIRPYGRNGQAVHWEPDLSPTAQQWAALNGILGSHPAHWMIWEGTPEQQTVGLSNPCFGSAEQQTGKRTMIRACVHRADVLLSGKA